MIYITHIKCSGSEKYNSENIRVLMLRISEHQSKTCIVYNPINAVSLKCEM